ncbi:MAG TPA: ABC transporter substrate-binding protein [Burkholderiales bacterium]|nr:ABC transporter substrate-binding protein [Burkholderiales bacterium]
MITTFVRDIFRCFLLGILGAAASGIAAEIVVGQVAPFSGALAPTGKGLQLGAQVYIDAVNAKGGINGAKIRTVSKDDGYKVDETLKQIKALLAEHKPVALFGLVGTGNVEAILKEGILDAEGVPVVGPRTGAYSLRNPVNPFLFHIRASYRDETEKMVAHLTPFGIKKIAALYQDDAFGKDGLSGIEAAMTKRGLSLVASGAYEKNTTKVEDAVKTIAKANPQAVLMISNTAASAEFVKQYRAIDTGAQLLTISVTDATGVVKAIGADAARGLVIVAVVPQPHKRMVSLVKEFQKDFQQYAPKDTELSFSALEGYVTAKVLVEGLRRAGPNPTRKSLQKGLESINQFDVGGYEITFGAGNRSGSGFVDIGVIGADGKLKL